MKTPVNNKGELSRNERKAFVAAHADFPLANLGRKLGCARLNSGWEF